MAANNTTNRRKFISQTFKGGLAVSIGFSAAAPVLQSFSTADDHLMASDWKTGFDQQPLPYAYNALENVIDAMTMEIHYSKHAAAYSKNVKEAATAEKIEMDKPLEKVLAK